MAPCLICHFAVILPYFKRKLLLMKYIAIILPLKSKLSGKFQRFNAKEEVSKCGKIVEFPKISIKMKNWKTFYEAKTASHLKKIIQSPPNLPPSR